MASAMTRFFTAAAALLAVAFAEAPSPALAAQSDWAEALQSRLRLLLVPGEDGGLLGGVEIALEPGWYTYWRAPGEAGIPPQLDFSASENVAAVEVHYPVPQRYDDGTSVSLVYFDHVVFPLTITPADPARPVRLRLDALYGVCEDICIPARAEASVELQPTADDDPLARIAIGEAKRRVPGPPIPGRLAVEGVSLSGEALEIAVTAPPEGPVELFAEGPQDWYLGQPKLVSQDGDIARFRLKLAGKPTDAAVEGSTFLFVAVAGGEAVEEWVTVGR
jgi:DsbC/DsbD-like thiol-disulfide interchange protein